MEESVFCTNCGASNPATAGFCFNCLAKLVDAPQAPVEVRDERIGPVGGPLSGPPRAPRASGGGLLEEVKLNPLINIDSPGIRWHYNENLDVTTGAPQKLYRHVRDAVIMRGYSDILAEEAPEIIGTAIEKTGTTNGYIVAEKLLRKIPNPWKTIGKVAVPAGMIILMLYGLYLGLSSGSSSGLLGGFVFIAVVGFIGNVLNAYLASLPEFESNVVVARFKGEVYYSALGTDISGGPVGAESRRASLTSELRLDLMLTTILSTNIEASRKAVQCTNTPEAREDFNGILADIRPHILPKVVLQESVKQAELHRAQPMPPPRAALPSPTCPRCGKQVSLEFVLCPFCGQQLRSPDGGGNVSCTNCGALNPPTARACFNCGNGLQKI